MNRSHPGLISRRWLCAAATALLVCASVPGFAAESDTRPPERRRRSDGKPELRPPPIVTAEYYPSEEEIQLYWDQSEQLHRNDPEVRKAKQDAARIRAEALRTIARADAAAEDLILAKLEQEPKLARIVAETRKQNEAKRAARPEFRKVP